jgi:hypothetical protein
MSEASFLHCPPFFALDSSALEKTNKQMKKKNRVGAKTHTHTQTHRHNDVFAVFFPFVLTVVAEMGRQTEREGESKRSCVVMRLAVFLSFTG